MSRQRDRGAAAGATDGDDKYDLARRIANAQRLGKGSSSRHEKDLRKHDRSEREKRHDHDSDRDRDRRRGDRDRPREKDRERDRGKDRKRSRRDRSLSGDESDFSHRHSRRSKRSHRDGYDTAEKERPSERGAASSTKDPHTLEREARNRERLMKEKQRRDAMASERDSKSSRRQHDRDTTSGRRLNYKYEGDDDDMSRVEEEREASRWR